MKDEWVVSRIFNKNNNEVKKTSSISNLLRINSIGDDLLDFSSLPSLMDDTPFEINNTIDHDRDHDHHDFKETNSSTNGYYFPSYLINNEINLTNQDNLNIPKTPLKHNMLSNDSYMNHQWNKECKMELLSTNNSLLSVSQDTCLSNEMNNDISSVVSKQETMGRNETLYEDFEYLMNGY